MNVEDVDDDNIISCTPVEILPEISKLNRTKQIYNKNNINSLVYYPGELSRPKHPTAFKPRNYDSKQVEVNYLRMICEIVELHNKKFRFPNVRTVGTYIEFKNLNHLKDNVTGHRIELDFSYQFSDKMPELFSSIMIMGSVKHKSYIKDNEKIFVPYIVIKTWEVWSGRINFQEFYYNARRHRSPQIDETVPIEEKESSSDEDLSDNEDFEKTDFFVNLKKDGLLNETTFVVSNNCTMSSTQDFEKTEFLNKLENDLSIHRTEPCEEPLNNSNDRSLFDESDNSVIL